MGTRRLPLLDQGSMVRLEQPGQGNVLELAYVSYHGVNVLLHEKRVVKVNGSSPLSSYFLPIIYSIPMKSLNIYTSVVSLLMFSVFFPLQSHATKTVSQEFDDYQEILAIFPFEQGSSFMLVEDDFYSSKTPGSAFDWKKTNYNFLRDDKKVYDPNPAIAAEYKRYDYITVTTDNSRIDEPIDFSFDPTTTEIWRMSKKGPKNIERVLNISARKDTQSGYVDNEFSDIFVFKNTLYAITVTGDVWQTENGTTWEKLLSSNLDENAYIKDATVTKKNVYVTDRNVIYRSKDLKTWKNINETFNTDSVLSINSLRKFNNNMYLTVSTDDNIDHLWKKNKNGKWNEIMTQDNAFMALYVTTVNNNLYLVHQTGKNEYSIKKSTNGSEFTKVLKTSAVPVASLVLGGKTVFNMYDGTQKTSYLVRVP